MDPESKVLLTIDLGERTLALAQRVVHHVAQVLAPDCAPLFLPMVSGVSDGLADPLWVLGAAAGARPLEQLPSRAGCRSRRCAMRKWSRPCGGAVVRVRHRVVFGTLEALQQVLAACGWQINPAFVERLNLSIRQHVAAVGRRVTTLCKHEAGVRQQLALYHVYHNCCLPHASVRLPWPQPEPTHGSGSATRWQPRTPAMAAGLTDHVWTLREVLLFRVPPGRSPRGCEQTVVVGKQPERPEQATCAPTTGCENVHRGEGRWEAVRALSSRPFCSCKGRPGKPVVIIRRVQVHGANNTVRTR